MSRRLAAITVRQPWSDQILDGTKTIENRSWNTAWRGPLLIHAGARGERGRPRGALGLVYLLDVHEMRDRMCALSMCLPEQGAEYDGAYSHHFALTRPYRFPEPLDYTAGRMGLWYPGPELCERIARASLNWEGWLA